MKQVQNTVKEKTFENFLDKKSNLSQSSIWLLKYGNKLINEYVDLELKIKQVKSLKDPDEEMEEILQDWVNHIVKVPPKKKKLTPQAIKQYANAVNEYLKYHRFSIEVKNLTFPKQLQEEKYAITVNEIQQILKVANWNKQAYYLCLISTGARPREILGLTKNDVEWVGDKYKAIIPAKLTKKGLSRTVFFSKECTPFLNQLMKRDGDNVFPHQPNLKTAISNEDVVFGRYCDKIGFTQRYETTGYRKISLYSFRSFFFTKSLDYLKDDIAHAMIGHGAYLGQYQRRTDEQKKQLWDELEPEILIFDQSKKEQKIRDLEVALKQNQDQQEINEFQKDEIERLTHAVDYLMKKEESKKIQN